MTYRTVAAQAAAEFTEKRSRFVAELAPSADETAALAFIEAVRRKSRDARHHVFAYRIAGGAERFSDDGEPQGTGGSPLMETLRRAQLTGTVLVVTRFFGGILLGAGGLTRAYAHAASLALAQANVVEKRPYARVAFLCSYAQYGQVQTLALRLGGEPRADFGGEVRVLVELPEKNTEDFLSALTQLTAGKAVPRTETGFYR